MSCGFTQQLADRLSEIPAVESAGGVTELPMTSAVGHGFNSAASRRTPDACRRLSSTQTVTPGYFRTLRIPVTRGRDFDSGDLRDGTRTVIVNQATAEQYWPGRIRSGSSFAERRWRPELAATVGHGRRRRRHDSPGWAARDRSDRSSISRRRPSGMRAARDELRRSAGRRERAGRIRSDRRSGRSIAELPSRRFRRWTKSSGDRWWSSRSRC